MNIQEQFENIGGTFITPINELQEKLKKVKAFIFDWDGVFNNGSKVSQEGSNFSEIDAMGINMVKLNYWLNNGVFPYTFVVTGEENRIAQFLAKRERMNAVFHQCKFKVKALKRICADYNLEPDEIAFVFDDILDVELARSCGVSFQINRQANPLFNQFLVDNKSCDYRTGSAGGNGGVREISEVIIGLTGDMNKTIETRIEFVTDYTKYLDDRDQIETICEPMI